MGARLPPELTLGFAEFDQQHRGLLEAVEAARAAALSGDASAARAAVASLGDALVAHFATEEGFMQESLYPDRARHKAAHDIFMQDFAQLGREMEGGVGDQVAQWIGTRVAEWVKFHIRVNDAPLAEYLSSRRFRPRAGAPRAVKPQAS
jgi:hemerythrin-like metal-binding protein